MCVRPCVNHKLVCAITHHPFHLGSPNLDHRCKRPWLRSLLFWEWLTLTFKVKFNFRSQNLPHYELVRAITHHPFELGPPNLDQRCKIPWLRSLLFWGLIEDWHVRFNLFSCLFASLLRLSNICETCINIWKRSLFHILNGCPQICSPTASCHGPWNSRVVSLVWPLLAYQGPRLGDWQMPKISRTKILHEHNWIRKKTSEKHVGNHWGHHKPQ